MLPPQKKRRQSSTINSCDSFTKRWHLKRPKICTLGGFCRRDSLPALIRFAYLSSVWLKGSETVPAPYTQCMNLASWICIIASRGCARWQFIYKTTWCPVSVHFIHPAPVSTNSQRAASSFTVILVSFQSKSTPHRLGRGRQVYTADIHCWWYCYVLHLA